ncbi:D-aminoacylase [candidate division KSB1 bacterium]|nr:D-aminoacylase [candidate division KSB1 bacterium]
MINRREFVKVGALSSAGLMLGCSLRPVFDILIKNGTLADGTKTELYQADIGISGSKIITIGDLKHASATHVIDATGLIVAPGFIDIHTHTDVELLVNPLAESKIHQGVTTEIGGNCGSSYFPLNDADFAEGDRLMNERYGRTLTWHTTNEFLDTLAQSKPSINFATFVGHGQIRSFVVGRNDVAPTPDQLKQMQYQLEHALEQGCVGMSTGLEYAPGSYAKTDELIALCEVVARHNKVYATHMRNEDDTVEEAIEEALRISRESGVALQISHLKACNRANWHKTERFLETLAKESQAGLPVHADRYPYVAYSTGLGVFLPLWARQGNTDDIVRRLESKTDRDKMKAYTESRGNRIGGWDRVQISSCMTDANKKWEGMSIDACSEKTRLEPFEFIRQLLIEERTEVNIVGFAMDENNLHRILQFPLTMIGSDGNAISPTGKLGEGKPHPRFYGTFPRILGCYCREEKLFDWPTAVKKMTSMPADKLQLNQRGHLQKDYFADVTIFNPQTVIDNATFVDPHQFASGIEYVIVNGTVTITDGKHTGKQAGTVIREI